MSVIGSVMELVDASRDPGLAIGRLADEATRIVSHRHWGYASVYVSYDAMAAGPRQRLAV